MTRAAGLRAVAMTLALLLAAGAAPAGSILFIGNSFTYAQGSPVRYYRADTVTDINGQGVGGVPALFKSFASQAGLPYEVFLETEPDSGIDWHLEHRLPLIGARAWDSVVLQSYSTLDVHKPGDPALLIDSVKKMAAFLRARNAAVELRLVATWPRADQTYEPKGAWYGKPIEAMALDVRAGVDRAAAATPGITAVIPVGQAWVRAMHEGIADANPYVGTAAGRMDLWTYDHYHASTYGYYLQALVLFGSITGRDPRSLGDQECSGFELGLSTAQVHALQQTAYEQLALEPHPPPAAPPPTLPARDPQRCARAR